MAKEYVGEFGVNNQLYFCAVPFRLDSYSGCQHQCGYCFARSGELTNSATQKREGNGILLPDPASFQRKLVVALDGTAERADIAIEWLRHRVPIHWGGMSDPFQPCEAKYQISKRWMGYINWFNYPTALSTKGTTILSSPEYMTLLKEGNYAVQVTLLGDDDELLHQIEPGAPLASERLKALSKFADAGIWTAVRIQPVFPNSTLEDRLPEFVEKLSKAGVRHVIAEGYKAQTRSDWAKQLHQLLPKVLDCYADVKYKGFEKLLPSERKLQYIKVIQKVCHENGMTFGAADNDMRDYGDTICCCGLDNLPGFENFWRYQASQAAKIAKEKGIVTKADMQQFWSGGEQQMDSGNALDDEGYEAVYGYKKGHAPSKEESKRKAEGGLLGIQDGEMRQFARGNKIPYTAKFCVDWMWDKGGECSPEVVNNLKKINVEGEIAYEYVNNAEKLEKMVNKQASIFDIIE